MAENIKKKIEKFKKEADDAREKAETAEAGKKEALAEVDKVST